MRSERVRRAAAKAAVTASKKTGRPVHPDVERLSGKCAAEEEVHGMKSTLVETLRAHGYSGSEESRISSRTVDFCNCGWRSTFESRTHTEHLADVILGLTGLAVIELPELVGVNGADNRVWSHNPFYIEQESNGDVIISDRFVIESENLRDTGEILLAAAAIHEGGHG